MNKKCIGTSLLAAVMISASALAQTNDASDSTGLPGDNLDLYGTLELFKKSASLEDFEKALNTENNSVNNLDLNGDGKIDYIRVVDNGEEEAHAVRLEVPVGETESQDVAVIELEKNGDASANLQIIGDEDLYGKDYIVEPADSVPDTMEENNSGGKHGPAAPGSLMYHPHYYNVWMWPCVKHVYGPHYVFWISPWKWAFYPMWWHPWAPAPWYVYHKRYYYCHPYHHRVYVYHINHAHKIYHAHRVSSPTVYKAHHNGGMHGGPVVKPGPYGNKPGPNGKPGPKMNKPPMQKQGGNGPKPGPKQNPNTGPKGGGGSKQGSKGGGGSKGHK